MEEKINIKEPGWWVEMYNKNGCSTIEINKIDNSTWPEILRSIADYIEEEESHAANKK